jgi:iron complex outermembrane receptor protein
MKLYLNPLWPTCALSFTLASPLWAETSLPTIIVSASRVEEPSLETPASITLITRQEIEASGAHDLLQLLQARGGLQINSNGTAQSATIDMRGFGPTASRNTLVLVDGRRLNNSSDQAAPDLASIDLRRVERIEIVQGSAGTLYGNQAVGGMINIITRTPQNMASVEAGLGSYKGRSLRVDLSQIADNGFSSHVNAKRETSDNYRDNNRTEYQDFNLRLDYDHSRGRVFIEHQAIDDEQQLPGALFAEEMADNRQQSAAAYSGDYSDAHTDITRIGLEQELSLDWQLAAEASYRNNDREFQNSARSFPGSLSTQTRKVKALNPRVIGLLALPSGEATLTAGADLERTDYDLVSSFGPQRLDQTVNAQYVQLTAPLSPTLSTTVGWRRGKVENKIDTGSDSAELGDNLNAGSIGLVLRPSDSLRLFLRLDENYRFATVDEHTNVLYTQPMGLENQTGLSQEAGIEWTDGGFNTKAILLRLDLENEISFASTEVFGSIIDHNINLEKTRREGVILEARWQATPELALSGSFTYTDPTITAGQFEGKRIPLVSARSARLSLDWQATEQWQLFAEGILRSDRVLGADFDNAFDTLPGYGLLNAGGQYEAGSWRLALRVDNLLDKAYAGSGSTGYDASFTKRASYFPAPERTFWLSARYQFE